MRRNHRKGGIIDQRDLMRWKLGETDEAFELQIFVGRSLLELESFRFRRGVLSKKQKAEGDTRIPRFLALLGASVGRRTELPILGGNDETLWLHFTGESEFEINFHGLLEAIDAAVHDCLVLTFPKAKPGANCVAIELVPAADKELDRELQALLESGLSDLQDEKRWLRLEWIFWRSFRASQIWFERTGDGVTTIDMAPYETFHDTHIFIQWQWLAPDEVQFEAVGTKFARPALTADAITALAADGWLPAGLADEDETCPNFIRRLRDPDPAQIAKMITDTFRRIYLAQSDDLIVIRPYDIADVVIDLPREDDHQKLYYPQGLLDSNDVEILYRKLHG